MVDIDESELNKKDLKLNMKIKCDAKYLLEALYKNIKNYKFEKTGLGIVKI